MRRLVVATLALLGSAGACAVVPRQPRSAAAETEVRQTIRAYDDALRRADVVALERYWADEYTFVNPSGQLVTRAERIANVSAGRTAFDTLRHEVREERIRMYGNLAVHTTMLALGARYGGQAASGDFRALVVWVYRDGRWQQVASQLTTIARP